MPTQSESAPQTEKNMHMTTAVFAIIAAFYLTAGV